MIRIHHVKNRAGRVRHLTWPSERQSLRLDDLANQWQARSTDGIGWFDERSPPVQVAENRFERLRTDVPHLGVMLMALSHCTPPASTWSPTPLAVQGVQHRATLACALPVNAQQRMFQQSSQTALYETTTVRGRGSVSVRQT